MEFYWLLYDSDKLILKGYSDIELIILTYSEVLECWESESKWFDFSEDFDFEQNQIDELQEEVLDRLKDHCNEQIDWWKGQIEMLEELSKKNS